MKLQWAQILFSAAVGTTLGGVLTASQQKIINRRKTLLKFNRYYEDLVDCLVETHKAGQALLGLPLQVRSPAKEARQKFTDAKSKFEKKATDFLELSLLIGIDFNWSENVFNYFKPAIQQCREFASNLDDTISKSNNYELLATEKHFMETNNELGYRYANVKKFFILQMSVFWVILPTLSLYFRIFYERAIGCPFSEWLLHESPPQLEKKVPVCSLIIMGMQNVQ
ncbi:MAG: hypothetical protein KKA54_10775 [Proteobacteria bacterium]|nr:hypothetical protein [Pseudomonadota bacterium]